MNNQILSPSDLVALLNQTLEFAYPLVDVEGEVANFKVSKNRWVYFDIVDEGARLRCFGTVYNLPAPVEDGMMVRITAAPRLHPQFGFSLNIQLLEFSGEGSIKKAADLLALRLEKEGLFASERKRPITYPPSKVALVTSAESAAYRDFIKVLNGRLGGIDIELADVAVQGVSAPGQLVKAIDWFNSQADIADVLVIIRGGGSADDLQAFSAEPVVRAVASSRIPTMVAIGHEIDVSLAELAADQRASTPSNAAELLVPDRRDVLKRLDLRLQSLDAAFKTGMAEASSGHKALTEDLHRLAAQSLEAAANTIKHLRRTLEALSPAGILKRGYAVVRRSGKAVSSAHQLKEGDLLDIQFGDGKASAEVQ